MTRRANDERAPRAAPGGVDTADRTPLPEPLAVEYRAVLLATGAMFGLLIVVAIALWLIDPSLHRQDPATPTRFAGPQLQRHPVARYRAWRSEQATVLDARAHDAGERIPIDDAMRRIAARGEAGWAPVAHAR
ncbi:MAG: hypothetical protein AB7P21_25935 [Lautropia sp.]